MTDKELIEKLATALDNLRAAAAMAREELVFGGDWKNAQLQLDKNLPPAREAYRIYQQTKIS